MLATVPLSTSVPVPLPDTVTPPAAAAVSVPLGTLNVTVTGPAAASTSLMLRPASLTPALSSRVVNVAGRTLTGASLTAVTFSVMVLGL